MTLTPKNRWRSLALTLLACFFAVAARAADVTKTFNVPSALAGQTPKTVRRSGSVRNCFSAETVAGATTNSVQGDFVPSDALDKMLSGTGLSATKDKTGAFAVQRQSLKPAVVADPDPAPAATAPTDRVLTLSPFAVSSQAIGRYEATEATSGTRYRMSLMEATQSVTVITHDLVQDW